MVACEHRWYPIYTLFWWKAVCIRCDQRVNLERRWPGQNESLADGWRRVERMLG